MGKVITINIQKGGVGKTTTAHELASNLTKMGYKVLAIDLDQQKNLSKVSGAAINDYWTMLDILTGKCAFEDAIQEIGETGEHGEINVNNYDVVPAHTGFKEADNIFNNWADVVKLREIVDAQVRNQYDYIIIDTPPSLGKLSQMALAAADYLVIPCSASSFSTQGLGALYKEIENQRKFNMGHAVVAGILLTQFSGRKIFEKAQEQTLKEIAKKMNSKVFKTYIRQAVAVEEAQAKNQSLIEYNPTSKPALDYKNFAEELLETINKLEVRKNG